MTETMTSSANIPVPFGMPAPSLPEHDNPAAASPARKARVVYEGDGVETAVEAGHTTLLEVSLANRIPHFRECGGRGRCTTCRVEVLDGLGNLTERTDREIRLAESRGWSPGIRLACQACPTGDVRLRRLVRAPSDVSVLQTESLRETPGREIDVAILSCDLRGFTPFADSHTPFDVLHVLNRVFGYLGDPILLNNGVIYQYVGDQVIGLFGVDGEGSAAQHCMQAVRAGLGMIDALSSLNESLSGEFDTDIDIRIGAHFGKLVVGYMGHPSRRAFSAIGDAMNAACRVEQMNKDLGTRFLITGSLLARLPAAVDTGLRSSVELKGKDGFHTLVEVHGLTSPDPEFLVQRTARFLLAAQNRLTETFYGLLFQRVPATRGMFTGDMEAQGQMLTQALQSAVYGLSRYDRIATGLRDLGRRHVAYGVQPAHYTVFIDIFLDAAQIVAGDRFTDDVTRAWRSVLRRISEEMCGEALPEANDHGA